MTNALKVIVLEERIVLDAAGAVLFIDVNATGHNDGSSWANAYNDLQSALSAAASTASAETIKIADGVYKPGGLTTSSFNIPTLTTLKGGYGGNTILSGDILGNDIAGDPLAAVPNAAYLASKADNAVHVVTMSGVTASMESITITKGFNPDQGAGGFGAGISITNASHVSLTDMRIDENHADGRTSLAGGGGGIDVKANSTLDISKSLFTNNTTWRVGGALKYTDSDGSISKSVFDNNRSNLNGGAALFSSTDALPNYMSIEKSTFMNNKSLAANGSGGAIRNDAVVLTIDHSDFIGNNAGSFGGVINSSANFYNNSLTISHSNFENNTANASGGAIFALGSATTFTMTLNIDHSDFVDNTAAQSGGAIFMARSAIVNIDHSRFEGNTATAASGGAIATGKAGNLATDPASIQLSIEDSKFIDNTAGTKGGAIYDNTLLNFTVNKSDFKGNTAGSAGGAILIDDVTVPVTATVIVVPGRVVNIDNSSFKDNSAAKGGAIVLEDRATVTANMIHLNVTDSDFKSNTANQAGAYFQSGGISTVEDNTFKDNPDLNGDEVVIDLPASVNGQTTSAAIVTSLVNENKKLSDDEILVLP